MSALKRQEFDTRIARRLRQIVNDETIEDFMGEAPDILERIQVLPRCSENFRSSR